MSQFTTMLGRLQKKNSEQTESTKSTLSQVASHARMCRAPVLEKALKIAMARLLEADCGESTQGSLASLDQDGSWLKTSEGCCQQVLISDREETLELFSGTWPTWGIMRFGRVTVLKPLARHTKGSECSSWPTPRANDPEEKYSDVDLATNSVIRPNGTRFGASLGTVINTMQNKMWRTPDANLGARGPKSAEMYEECKKTNKHALNLLDQVKHECNWPTPSTQEIEHDDFEITATGRRKSKDGRSSHSINLADTVKQWPTPRSREGNAGEAGSKGAEHNAKKGYLDGVVLQLERSKNECTNKADTGKVLPMLWEEIREKKVQRKVRRFKRFQPENVLRDEVYGVGTSKGDTEQVGYQQAVNQEKKSGLRNVWNDRKPTNAPYRRQSVQQQGQQSNDTMRTLSHEMALGTRQNDEAKISGLCRVRCGKPCESHVSKALAKIQEVRRPDDDKNKDRQSLGIDQRGNLSACWVEILMGLPIGWTDIDCEEPQPWPGWPAPMNAGMRRTPMAGNPTKNGRNEPNLPEQAKITESGQYPYEPPRVTVGQKNRAKRLKCLGNGCCPAQIYPIFKAIMEIERVRKCLT